MNLAFAGFRHAHIIGLYRSAAQNARVNILGCYESDRQARKCAEKEQGISFKYESYEDILSDNRVDAVAIGDYYSRRGKMVIEALKCGKHVICDKPICTDIGELDEIERLSHEKGLNVCCMLDLRYMPQTEKVKKLVKEGAIGQVHIISFTGQHCLDYENRPGWYFEKGKHGGTLNDIAIHGIDLVRYITGKDLTEIDYAKTWNAFAYKTPDFKDCGQLAARFDSVSVMADVSYSAPKFSGTLPTYWDFKLWGSDGMISFNFAEPVIKVYKTLEITVECEQTAIGYLDAFVDEINGKQTKMNTADILASQRQTLLIQKYADERND
ncbi:MAG: Gfo/Idh/MocA family oxidoreductase [Clostridia bacterium]|nr:Gfo/Idh/MocA family oxidoreductase [Clostridia bacterium]